MADEQETVFGLDKSLDECDNIFWVWLEKYRREENMLFSSKWFDYRELHVVHATYLFADAYRRAYKEAFARAFDRERAEHVKAHKGSEDIFDLGQKRSADATGYIRARQHADMLGMPYLEYARTAISWALRRRRDYMPRPCHLYEYSLLTAIQATWQDRQKGKVFLAEAPIFRNGAYAALPMQDAHHEWILQQAALRANNLYYLQNALYEADVLLESKVEARFGRDVLERVRALN